MGPIPTTGLGELKMVIPCVCGSPMYLEKCSTCIFDLVILGEGHQRAREMSERTGITEDAFICFECHGSTVLWNCVRCHRVARPQTSFI